MSSTSDPANSSFEGADTPVPKSAQDNLKMSAFDVGILVAVSVVLNTLLTSFYGLKGSFLIKNVLHLSASDASTFGIIAAIPAYLRPFMGTGADLFPLLGFHRRTYYILSWLLYAAGLLSMAATPTHEYSYGGVVMLTILYVAGANLLFVIMDAIMVSIGNVTGTIGRLQAIQQGLPLVMALTFSSKLAGYVAQNWSYQRCFLIAGLLAAAGALVTLLIHEKPVGHHNDQHGNTLHEQHLTKLEDRRDMKAHAKVLGKALSSPGLWVCVVYVFYLILTPGTNTAQFYYSTVVIHLSAQQLGNLGMPGSAGSIIGTLIFLFFSRKLPTAAFVWGAFLGDMSVYPMLFFWHSYHAAEAIAFLSAVTGQLYYLCLLTFAAKACPKGIEASIYALFVAATSLAGTLGDKLGSSIYDYFGPSHHHSITYGWFVLLWSGIALTAIAAFMVPFLPRWARDPQFERELEQSQSQPAAS